MRTIRAVLCIVLLSAVTETRRADGQPVSTQVPPDTGFSCPVGFVRVMQLHAWAIPPTAVERLFRDSTARTLPAGWKAFRGPELRKQIAKVASVKAIDVRGGWATQAFFGEPRFKQSFLDSTGNGLAMLIRDTGAGLVGSACVVVDSGAAAEGGALLVLEGRSMLIGASVNGIPHAIALRIATVPSKNRREEAQAFREGVMKVVGLPTHNLFPTKVTASIDSCLNRPTSGASRRHGS